MDRLEREEDAIQDAYERGELSLKEMNHELRELHRDYRGAAEEAARDAYEREMDRW